MVEVGDILQFKKGALAIDSSYWNNLPVIVTEITDKIRITVRYQFEKKPVHGIYYIDMNELNKYFEIENKL